MNPGDEYSEGRQASTNTAKSEVLHDIIITKSASVMGNDKSRLAMLELKNEDNCKNSNSAAANTSITAEVTGDSEKPRRPTSFFDR